MRIGKERIKGLTQRNIASGLAYYWEPNAAERKAGWRGLALGQELGGKDGAIAKAKKRNEEIEAWKAGGARPRAIAKYVKASTFGALLDRYKREKLPRLAASTQRVDKSTIKRLDEWAGDKPVDWITRARVRALRDGLMKYATVNGPGHAVAFYTLTVLRRVLGWAKDEGLVAENPAERFNLSAPAPRYQIWETADEEAFDAAADAEKLPETKLAVALAAWLGQREGDLLRLTERQWKESAPLEPALQVALAGEDGRVMGFELKQAKTGRWIFVPVAGELRTQVEAAIAANRRRKVAVATILVCESTGQPWNQRNFIRAFNQVRQRAVKDGHAPLADLQFRDLRRTCVVRLGRKGLNDAQISAISGHQLETTKRILETYMPRDHAMAASAIVATIRPKTGAKEAKEKTA